MTTQPTDQTLTRGAGGLFTTPPDGPERDAEVRALVLEHFTLAEIAAKLGRSKSTVHAANTRAYLREQGDPDPSGTLRRERRPKRRRVRCRCTCTCPASERPQGRREEHS